jgi:hypothetical protein
MEVAKLLTDNFIKKSGNSTSQESLVMLWVWLYFNQEAFEPYLESHYEQGIP